MRYAMCLMVLLAWGCAADEKNYLELEREDDPFRTEHDPLFQGVSLDDRPIEQVLVAPADEAEAPRTPDGIEIVEVDEPSLDGLDRTHWPTIRFTAARGLDGQAYAAADRFLEIDPRQRFEAALSGAEAGNVSAGNVGGALLDPVRAAADFLALPVRMVSPSPGGAPTTAGGPSAGAAPTTGGGGGAPRSPAGP